MKTLQGGNIRILINSDCQILTLLETKTTMNLKIGR